MPLAGLVYILMEFDKIKTKVGLLISEKMNPSMHSLYRWLKRFNCQVAVFYDQNMFTENNFHLVFSSNNSFCFHLTDKSEEKNNIVQDFDVFFQYKWTSENLSDKFTNFVNKELIVIRNFFLETLHERHQLIGFINTTSNSKIRHLIALSKSGLRIPKTILCNNKEAINHVIYSNSIIVKAIQNTDFENKQDGVFAFYTERENSTNLVDRFFPITIQEEISKVVEIRCFIFFDNCYALAYLPNKSSDIVDIRLQYTNELIEVYPYQLPQEIFYKLREALDDLKLDMASIDLILDEHDNYVVLDINPSGQISQLSLELYPQIEREIATHIIQNYGRYSEKTSNGNTKIDPKSERICKNKRGGSFHYNS